MDARIAAVLFDFDHTLGTDNHLEERVMRMLAERHCGIEPADDEIASALARFRSGAVSLAEMLADAFAAWGYAGDVEPEFRAEALRELPGSLSAAPGARETLAALAADGLALGILTNGWTELQHAKAALLGFRGLV